MERGVPAATDGMWDPGGILGGLPGGNWRPGGFPVRFWGRPDGEQRPGIPRWPTGSWGLTPGVFLAGAGVLAAHFGTVSPLSMSSINQQLFLQKS